MIPKQIGFDFDADRCVQCHACEIACKSLHDIEFGVKWRRVTDVWDGEYPNAVNRTLSLSCLHCGDPACVVVCPTGAIMKRVHDGIVVVDQNKCIGCHSCFLACPFGVPQFGLNGKMQKCDFCVDRLMEGREPACVETCPADALHFGTMDELARKKTEKASHKILTPLLSTGRS
jgi:anaerobic dimethyl sulfoxide reductase subunit B (iron-sulfur subunit)